MMNHRLTVLLTTLLFGILLHAGCISQTRPNLDIRKSGFLDNDCYQAVIEIEANEGTQGLTERRDNAFLKAKTIDARERIVESLANYCIESKLAQFNVAGQRKNLDLARLKADLAPPLRKIIRWEKMVFFYYNEKMSAVLGYQFSKKNLKDSVNAIIDGMELGAVQ